MKAINLFCNAMIILGVYLIVFTDIQQKQVVVEHQPLDITIQIQPEKVSMVLPEPVIDTTNKETFETMTKGFCSNTKVREDGRTVINL